MTITKSLIEQLIFNRFRAQRRFTQDSPIFPDVWMEYFDHRNDLDGYRANLILAPHRKSTAADLFLQLSVELTASGSSRNKKTWCLASNGETVAVSLTLKELVTVALPLTPWWHNYVLKEDHINTDRRWLTELVGAILLSAGTEITAGDEVDESLLKQFTKKFNDIYASVSKRSTAGSIVLWSVSRNGRQG